VLSGTRLVTESDLPSHEVAAPCRVFSLETLAPSLLRRTPHALYPRGLGYRVFPLQAPEKHLMLLGFLSWASAPLQRRPKHRAAALSFWFSKSPTSDPVVRRQLAAPPLRFWPLQRLPSTGQRHDLARPACPTACAFRLSQPLGAFIRPEPTRPCFMPDPLLGSPFRAFFLSRSRSLFPAPLPS